MKLSILMPALESRDWISLFNKIDDQISSNNLRNSVEILAQLDDGKETSGVKRNKLTELAKGEYICFVDDDDDVSDDYVLSLFQGTLSGATVVTFDLLMRKFQKDEIWKFGCTTNYRSLGLMTVNHLCAWKKSVATKVAWPIELGNSDDHFFFEPLFNGGFVVTEFHINKILYIYQYSAEVTQNQTRDRIVDAINYCGNGIRCYFDEDKNIYLDSGYGKKTVRDKYNKLYTKDQLGKLEVFHVIELRSTNRIRKRVL